MRKTTLLVIALLVVVAAGPALSQTQGPVFPPPGGVTWSLTGDMGTWPYATLSFSNFDLSQSDDLWWTSVDTGYPSLSPVRMTLDGGIDEAGEYLTYDTTSPVSSGVARWFGVTDWNCPVSGFTGWRNVSTRFTLTFTPSTNLLVGASQGVSAPYVHMVDGSFSVKLEAAGYCSTGPPSYQQWRPINEFPQWAGNTGDTMTHHFGGFYYTDPEPSADDSPEPATWVLLACTGGLAALRRRRRA